MDNDKIKTFYEIANDHSEPPQPIIDKHKMNMGRNEIILIIFKFNVSRFFFHGIKCS